MTPRAPQSLLYSAGLVLGAANTLRHRYTGYVNPRPFPASDVDKTISYSIGVVDKLEQLGGVSWTGQRVLELGPGSDLSSGAIMLARGATSYHAVDLFDNRWQAADSLYDGLRDRLAYPVSEADLNFTQTSFPELPDVSGAYDLIVSNACLEHVADVPALFRRLRELGTPGAKMVHNVDAKAHMRWFRDRDPLNPLRYSDRIYRSVLTFPGAPNRLRSTDFVRSAAQAGWTDTSVIPVHQADADYLSRTHVAARFRAYPDLSALTFVLVSHG